MRERKWERCISEVAGHIFIIHRVSRRGSAGPIDRPAVCNTWCTRMCVSGFELMAWLQLDSFLSPPSSCLAAAEIKMHPWFKDVDWQNLAKNKAAFVPNVQDVLDTSYFLEKKPVSAKVRKGSTCNMSNNMRKNWQLLAHSCEAWCVNDGI